MRSVLRGGGVVRVGLLAALLLPLGAVHAIDFSVPLPGSEDGIKGVLNTTFTAGVGVRMQSQSQNLVGKSNIDPNVCGGPDGAYQICQGLFKDQLFPAQHLAGARGAASMNGDQGDLNYSRFHLFQAPAKVTSDLNLTWHDFGIFARALYFYDAVNNDFTETHPNEITPQNRLQVGRHVAPLGGTGVITGLAPCVQNLLGNLANPNSPFFTNPLGIAGGVLGAGCPAATVLEGGLLNNRNYGQPDGNGNFIVYGRGGYVRSKRTDGEALAQAGTNMQYLDSYLYGKLPIPFTEDKTVSFKIGRQLVNWGESTTLVLNSINQANPVNANNVFRIGGQVEEFFTPINMVDVSFEPFSNATVEGFYQLEWQPIEIQTPGTYFSSLPIGTNNVGNSINASFGQAALDPYPCFANSGQTCGTPQDNPLAGITNSTSTIMRLPDREARTWGQFGVKLDYYADNFNNGTDLSLYYMRYNSRLPYASFYSTNGSCARKGGKHGINQITGQPGADIDATDPITFLQACPDLPVFHALNPGNSPGPEAQYATSDTLGIDTARFLLEYPNKIDLVGFSFNTTVGSYSIQGEIAYRPNLPLQVDTHDLAFAAFGPTLTACHRQNCIGTHAGVGFADPATGGGVTVYGPSDKNTGCLPGTCDTFDLAIGNIDGSARSFPNFVIPYRGGVIGENPANSYIRGYERFQVFQFNLGFTRVLGATDNPFGASQVLIVGEAGAEYVPFLPRLDQLVLQGPNSTYGPVAGADGSGADGSRMSCAGSADCVVGGDGLRFNPHQQDASGYPTAVSYGYRLISQLRYESILPNINLRPFLVWKQDIGGISPGPGGNFVKGTKEFDSLFEFQYKQSLAFTLGYTWYWGGGVYNVLSDRDFAQAFIKYQF
ncbi:MAG TPA: DUF1302 family protein [Nevskia sp.]|nr:DUF1302 family protein [Nevskia sp.]